MNRFTAPLLAASSWLAAQTSLTVPSNADGRDGLGLSPLAGAAVGRRQQFLIHETQLPGLRGHQITGISFRRDGQLTDLGAGLATVRVMLAQGTLVHPSHASPSFDANLGMSGVTVFQGQISLPASARPPNRDAVGFGPLESVRITFGQPFTYTGGTLCLDIAGTPVTGSTTRAWPIDVDRDGVRGYASVFGTSCIQMSQQALPHIAVDVSVLRPGSTMRLQCYARAGDPCLLLLSAQRLGSSLNLAFLGSPMCDLWVMPDISLWAFALPTVPGFPASANALLHIPHESAFLGAALYAQWLAVQAGQLRTSEGLSMQLASSLARLDGAMVLSTPSQGNPWPSSGQVDASAVPVMQVHYQ